MYIAFGWNCTLHVARSQVVSVCTILNLQHCRQSISGKHYISVCDFALSFFMHIISNHIIEYRWKVWKMSFILNFQNDQASLWVLPTNNHVPWPVFHILQQLWVYRIKSTINSAIKYSSQLYWCFLPCSFLAATGDPKPSCGNLDTCCSFSGERLIWDDRSLWEVRSFGGGRSLRGVRSLLGCLQFAAEALSCPRLRTTAL